MTTRLRGVHVAPSITSNDIVDLIQAKVNLVRYAIAPYHTGSIDDWRKQVEDHSHLLGGLAATYPEITWIANLARANPGPLSLNEMFTAWEKIHSNVSPHVRHYGVLNEPPFRSGLTTDLMKRVGTWAAALNDKIVPVLTFPFSDPPHFLERNSYEVKKAWYEVHMYLPLKLTHQGVYDQYPPGPKYPAGMLNIDRLVKFLRPVRDFQLKHRRQILLGEFSISVFADQISRRNYIRDVINIAESWGWNWIYHAFRESPVWEPEGTKVWDVLTEKWKKNEQV